jgi:CheY-like chemotaxis protein
MIRILIVEPDPMYRKLFPIWIRKRFGSAGLEIATAPGAAEALEAARAAPPDLLLTAFELESLDGLQLARRIRDAGGAAAVIIIAQTAYQRLACELAQTPDSRYLAKPVGEKAFGETVESVLLAARAGDAPTP